MNEKLFIKKIWKKLLLHVYFEERRWVNTQILLTIC